MHPEILHAKHALPIDNRCEERMVHLTLFVLGSKDAITPDHLPNSCRITGEKCPTFKVSSKRFGISL